VSEARRNTMLQDGRSQDRIPMRSLNFLICLVLPAALWPWVWLSLQQKWVPGIFLGDKGRTARKADNLTAICEPIVFQPYGPSRPVIRIDLSFTPMWEYCLTRFSSFFCASSCLKWNYCMLKYYTLKVHAVQRQEYEFMKSISSKECWILTVRSYVHIFYIGIVIVHIKQ
jgi:hypothetical protein